MRKPVSESLVSFNLPLDRQWVITTDPEFNQALDYILHTSYNLFINGPAGTGKTVLLELAYRMLEGTTMVIGSTGVAASKLSDESTPTSTIHCGLHIRPLDIYSRDYNPSDKNDVEGKKILRGVDTLLIEEVGMVSATLFDHIGTLVTAAEKSRKRPIRIICFGDVLQLPPVVKDHRDDIREYYRQRYNNKIFFFNSFFFHTHRFHTVPLNTIYRQSEFSFQNILNRLRTGTLRQDDLDIINEQVTPIEKFKKKHPLSLILAPKTSTVKRLNEEWGRPRKGVKKIDYTAVSTDDFDWKESGLVEPKVTLWEGQQVMCIHNELGCFQNGTLCQVVEATPDCITARRADGTVVFIRKHKWTQYRYDYDPESGTVKATEAGSVIQIGCKPAAASTIHKSQGLTLDSVYLDLSDGWIPDSGVYLGLSRCKTLEGIGLSRPIVKTDIHIMEEPLKFINDL